MGPLAGDRLRRVRPGFASRKARFRGFNLIIFLSLIVILAISIRTTAIDSNSSVSANCDECHAPSIYLIADIQVLEPPMYLLKNESTPINITVEVSSSHKSYVWSGFGMDVWLSASTDLTDCGPHQILNGQKPRGQSSPFTWYETFQFLVNSTMIGNETISFNARMSPVHESPPVTARTKMVLQVVADKEGYIQYTDVATGNEIPVVSGKEKEKIGPIGLAIIIIGSLALFGGVLYVAYSILAPVDGVRNGKGQGDR